MFEGWGSTCRADEVRLAGCSEMASRGSVTPTGTSCSKMARKSGASSSTRSPNADMTKADALNEHLKWVAGLDHVQQPSVPSAPRTFQEVWERYQKLKEESGAWGKHHASTLRAVMKHWVLCTIGDADR